MNTENIQTDQVAADVRDLLLELADIGPANIDALIEFYDFTEKTIDRAVALGLAERIEEDGERGVELTKAGADVIVFSPGTFDD